MEGTLDTILYPEREAWPRLMQRGITDTSAVRETVAAVLADVRRRGDQALLEYEERFDGVTLTSLRVSEAEMAEAESLVGEPLKEALAVAAANIRRFHEAQRMQPISVVTTGGVTCSQRAVPIQKVGLYVPGGTAPLFSTVLMLAIPAKIAGCRQIVLCTPPDRQGKIHPAILYAARMAGVTEIYKIGGSQAIAAMAYGTETVPRVYKIFGPGNRFVMEAKQQTSVQNVAIDMPAGPSEVMIIADGEANPTFVAADFLSQAEHGADSQSILLTTDRALAEKVADETERLLAALPRRDLIRRSLSHSRIIVLANEDEMMDFANEYAPEHLIINHKEADRLAERVENAGSVFLGAYACESAGDYASGTNHTLPTSGYAHAYSGVNLDSFMKKITFQTLSEEGIAHLGPVIETLAENEELMAHKLAATVRINAIKEKKLCIWKN